jgi:anti-sigma factor RsiW
MMDGPTPHVLNEDDLVAAIIDPDYLSAEARQHLAQCPTCAERVAPYRQFASALTSRLYRWDCPTTQEISDYAAGWLRGKRRRVLTLHVKRCPRCAEELEISRQFLAPVPLPAVFRQRLVAQLVPQRGMGSALAGLRGASSEDDAGWPRQYQVNGISLSLHRAAPSSGGSGAMLLGLISRAEAPPETFANMEVRLTASDAAGTSPLITEQIDDLGNFVLSPVPTGRFNLLILLPEGELVIEGLELSG